MEETPEENHNHICVKCSQVIVIQSEDRTKLVVCPSCNKVMRYNETEELTLQNKLRLTDTYKLPGISIGDRIRYKDEDLTVIGFAVFKEQHAPYSWSEFYLKGLTTTYSLSEFKGGYCMFREVFPMPGEIVELSSLRKEYNGEEYRLYNKYIITLKQLGGEIPFDPDLDTAAAEYVCPPQMLIVQKIKDKPAPAYFLGEYVSRKEMEEMFNRRFPDPEVTPATKVLSRNFDSLKIFRPYLILVICIGVFFGFYTQLNPAKRVTEEAFVLANPAYLPVYSDPNTGSNPAGADSGSVAGSSPPKEGITKSFHITGEYSVIEVSITGELSNNWMGLDMALVNEKTNEEYYFACDLEYYEGYTDGESWKEGSREENLLVAHLPEGNYHLVFTAETDPLRADSVVFVKVDEDPGSWANLLWILGILAIVPALVAVIEHRINKKRWENSDFNPYIDE